MGWRPAGGPTARLAWRLRARGAGCLVELTSGQASLVVQAVVLPHFTLGPWVTERNLLRDKYARAMAWSVLALPSAHDNWQGTPWPITVLGAVVTGHRGCEARGTLSSS